MYKAIRYFLTIAVIFTSGALPAQTKPAKAPAVNNIPAVKVIGKAKDGAILLRWAASSPLSWKNANIYGYTIERYTILRNGVVLPRPEKQVLNTTPIKPRPLAAWEKMVDTSDYGAIVAQAIYGESFKAEVKKGGSQLMDIVNRASELEQRFSYALFACDRSYAVAQFAGLGYIDKTAQKGEKYLYRVFTNIPVAKMKIDTGSVYIGPQDERPLPRPLDMAALYGDKSVLLGWNYTLLKDVYNSYILERASEASPQFVRLNKEPLVNVNEHDSAGPSRIFYTDSIAANYTTYMYRVRGIDAFGELGPPSDTVKGQGLPSLPYNPKITKYQITKDNKVDFAWDFPAAGNELITGFSIVSAASAKGPFDTLQRNIPAQQRQWLLEQPLLPSNYMEIVAIGRNGTVAPSFPVLVQPEDTTPPAVPVGLQGMIDSMGIITVHWPANKERDLMGYRIFRAPRADVEFVQLTTSPGKDTLFTDTIDIKSMNSKIYYKIRSVDQRYNQSAFSAILELKKPDLVPPSAPAFEDYKIDSGKVKLKWFNSYDKDVVKYQVLRKEKENPMAVWQVVQSYNNTGAEEDSLVESPPARQVAYQYTVESIDENGLHSNYASPLTILVPNDAGNVPMPKIKTVVDRDEKHIVISWQFPPAGVSEYWLYRAEGNGPLTLLQMVDATTNKYTDKQLHVNTVYRYTVKAVLQTGRQSKFSEIVPVNY